MDIYIGNYPGAEGKKLKIKTGRYCKDVGDVEDRTCEYVFNGGTIFPNEPNRKYTATIPQFDWNNHMLKIAASDKVITLLGSR